MLKNIRDLNFYELLEVSPGANSTEIHRAYERVRRIYEPNSIALYSLFSTEEAAAIHSRIEEAYRTLMYEGNRKKYDAQLRGADPAGPIERSLPAAGYVQPSHSPLDSGMKPEYRIQPAVSERQQPQANTSGEGLSPISPLISEFTGSAIKVIREQRNLSVRNIADITKLSSRYIEAIEEENYSKLPARPYLRGFLVLYAKALGYEPERVVSDYLKRYDATAKKTLR